MASGKRARRDNVIQLERNPVEYGFTDVKPLNFIQAEYLRAIQSNQIVFGVGSAGTGKTYVAATYAAGELFHRRIQKIILTRPNVETGRGLGFLPGTLEEKYAPYLEPFDNVFTRSLGKGFYEYALKAKTIDALLTPNALLQLKAITSVNVITGNIGYGAPNKPTKAAVTPGQYNKNPVAKALLGDNASLEEKSKLHLGAITDVITEPQLKKTPIRSVFLITGIDVLNPGIEKTVHPNYPVGPRGKVIGVIEQPKSMLELFPSAYNNAVLGKAQEDAGKNRKRTDQLRLSETIPVGMGLVNKEFQGRYFNDKKELDDCGLGI